MWPHCEYWAFASHQHFSLLIVSYMFILLSLREFRRPFFERTGASDLRGCAKKQRAKKDLSRLITSTFFKTFVFWRRAWCHWLRSIEIFPWNLWHLEQKCFWTLPTNWGNWNRGAPGEANIGPRSAPSELPKNRSQQKRARNQSSNWLLDAIHNLRVCVVFRYFF